MIDTTSLARVAAFGLPSAHRAGAALIGDDALEDLRRHALGSLALAAVEAGELGATPELRRRLEIVHEASASHAVTMERLLLEVTSALRAAAVRSVVLKGPAYAHALYPAPDLRPFTDLDLLVSGTQWRSAVATLVELGFDRMLPEPARGFDERFGRAVTLRHPMGWEIDLHRTLALGAFGRWIDADELIGRTRPFELAGVELQRLDPETTVLHACVHAVLGDTPVRLLSTTDVAQAIFRAGADPDVVMRLATRWRLREVVLRAIGHVRGRLGLDLPDAFAGLQRLTPSRAERGAVRAFAVERHARGAVAISAIPSIPGLTAKLAYVRSLAVPSAAFMRVRSGDAWGGGYPARLARLLRPAGGSS